MRAEAERLALDTAERRCHGRHVRINALLVEHLLAADGEPA